MIFPWRLELDKVEQTFDTYQMATEKEGAPAHGTVAHLLPQTYKHLVTSWLEEDAPSFDYGGFVVGDDVAEARLLGKGKGIVAGVPFFDEVFRQLDCK